MTRAEEHGTIDEVWAQEGYGYVLSAGGERLRFERAAVARGDFARLTVGASVAFVSHAAGGEDEGVATDVRLVHRGIDPSRGGSPA